jgi:hypothetical protein
MGMGMRYACFASLYALLTLGLIYGSPIEAIDQPCHRIGILILAAVCIAIFYVLFKLSRRFLQVEFKVVGICLTVLIALPFLWIGAWTIPSALFSDDYPMWQDVGAYTNDKGDVIMDQFIEISGSLHAMQNRKIIHDFRNGIRVSYIYPDKKINGIWTYHQFERDRSWNNWKDTTYTANYHLGRMMQP